MAVNVCFLGHSLEEGCKNARPEVCVCVCVCVYLCLGVLARERVWVCVCVCILVCGEGDPDTCRSVRFSVFLTD